MKKYLRFGKIPENGKSVNFFKMTFEQNENFTFCVEMGDMEAAYECIPEDAFEDGVSVFEIKDDLPLLGSMRLIKSLCGRLDHPAYIVTGEIVGRGNDGEPLVTVESAKPVRIEKEKLVSLVMETLKNNFKNAIYKSDEDFGENQINSFYISEKPEHCFNGWTFMDPVDGFDEKTGWKER